MKKVNIMKPIPQHYILRLLGSKSIRKSFTVPFVLQFCLSIGVIGFLLLQGGNSASQLILEELQQQTVNHVSEQLTQRMSEALQLNQINYDALQSGILKLDATSERERFFVNHIKSYPNIAMTYVGLADGSFYGARRVPDHEYQVVRNNPSTDGASWYYKTTELGDGIDVVDQFPDFDARKRPWYIKAEEVEGPTFSGIYSHFIFHEPTVTASYPIYDQEGQLIGVFGVDYLLSWLGKTLGDLSIGDSGQVFVTDDTGLLIASSLGGKAYKMIDNKSKLILAKDSDNPLIHAASGLSFDNVNNNLQGFKLDREKYYVGVESFRDFEMNWNIYVVLAENDFLVEMKRATEQTVMVIILSLIIFFFVSFWIAKWVTKPIMRLNQAANELTQGRLQTLTDVDRDDELGDLSRSFNIMGKQLTELVSNLEEQVDLRTFELQVRNEMLEQLSFLDGLTSIANRRKFDSTLENAWNLAFREKMPLSLIMLDIDFFKDYNDTYGHQAGDDCLIAIASLLHKKARRLSDLVARYGGEEFMIIVQSPETLDKVLDFAEDIRTSVEALAIEHKTSPFKTVTLSIGVVYRIPTKDITTETFVKEADQALYKAKNCGRNRIEISQ